VPHRRLLPVLRARLRLRGRRRSLWPENEWWEMWFVVCEYVKPMLMLISCVSLLITHLSELLLIRLMRTRAERMEYTTDMF
jgi:hypothetical protein